MLSVGRGDEATSEGGFTLLEVVCVLAIIAMLAAIILPAIPHGTSRARLEAYAVETATLLKADHDVAMRRRAEIVAEVSAISRTIRSGTTGRQVLVPTDVHLEALLPIRCNRRLVGNTITFFGSGMSCGGVIALTRFGNGYQIRVNWLTGGVEVVPVNAL
jgi:general secretion pathway protein H